MDIPMNKTYIESDFPDWTELEQLRYNNYKPAYKERKIQKIALEWLPYSPSETPFGGGWHWGFCVSMEQEKRWNFIEFREGFEYGRTCTHPCDRDKNPYHEHSRRRSWDCGYIWGLSNKSEVDQ